MKTQSPEPNPFEHILMPKVLHWETCNISKSIKSLGLTIGFYSLENNQLAWDIKGFTNFVKKHMITYCYPPFEVQKGISPEEVAEKYEGSLETLKKYCNRWKKNRKKENTDPDHEDIILEPDHTPLKGVLGEWFLHAFLIQLYGTSNLYSKLYLHQGKQAVHGFDVVHYLPNNDNTEYTLWLGEAKFYSNVQTGITAALDSLKKATSYEYLKAQERESGDKGEMVFISRYAKSQNNHDNSDAFKKLQYFLDAANRDDFVSRIVIPVLIVLPEPKTAQLVSLEKNDANQHLKDFTVKTIELFKEKLTNNYQCLENLDLRIIVLPLGNFESLVTHFEQTILGKSTVGNK